MRGRFERFKALLGRYLRPEDSLLEVLGGVIVVLATVNALTVTRNRAGVDQLMEASFSVAIAWGLVDGLEQEYGSVDMAELVAIRSRFGLPIERDLYWQPRPLTECLR